MGLEALLDRMESATTDTPASRCNTNGVTLNPAPTNPCTPVTRVTPHRAHIGGESGVRDQAVDDSNGRHYRWWVILADGGRFEVRVLPEATADAVRELYLGATVEPIPDGVE